MFSLKCELGEVLALGEEEAALAIAKEAALQVQFEQLFAVKAERRGGKFVPTVLFTRQMGHPLTTMGPRQVIESEVIVHPETRTPTGFFFRFRREACAGGSTFIETWEEDLSGRRAGPAQLVFLSVR